MGAMEKGVYETVTDSKEFKKKIAWRPECMGLR